jgi:hypothetical protein
VHLRQFISPGQNRLLAVRKSDGATFSPRTRDVCRIEEGSTNAYLQEPRAIEKYLTSIEPKYTDAVEALRRRSDDQAAVETVAGFAAYVSTCSPAAMRVFSEFPRLAVETTAVMMEARGLLPPVPKALGGGEVEDLFHRGKLRINIDAKFPQSFGISQIRANAAQYLGFDWDVLHARADAGRFVTTDFPVGVERSRDLRILNRVLPLAPDLAVRILPQLVRKGNTVRRHRFIGRNELSRMNTLFVRCAEDVVFYGHDQAWVPKLAKRERRYRVVGRSTRIPTERGYVMFMTTAVEQEPED